MAGLSILPVDIYVFHEYLDLELDFEQAQNKCMNSNCNIQKK